MYVTTNSKKYASLVGAAGIGSMLGSGVIIGLSATITVWQAGLGLSETEVGVLSGALTFAIAAGSLLAGSISKRIGLIRLFGCLNALYALGAAVCVLSGGFWMLLAGLVIAGFASGADLPVSLAVISRDAPDASLRASMVSATQFFWQIGIFASYIMAFIASNVSGDLGARIVLGTLGAIALMTFLWRTLSSGLKRIHAEGSERQKTQTQEGTQVSVAQLLLDGSEGFKNLKLFMCILIFYVCWNLPANTFAQFQTYILVKANASQTLATGLGIALNVLGLFVVALFASVAGSKTRRNKFFAVGIAVQAAAMFAIALGGGTIVMILASIACYNIGSQFAGEAIYKVWTQESFPQSVRTSVQGFVGGFSRFCCGVFALVTPWFVADERIQKTMLGFVAVILLCAASGALMVRLQKHYRIV